jgi:CheY-like chemotaxis protein
MAEKPDLIFLDLVLAQQNDSAIEQILSAQADIPLIVFANGSLSAEEIDQLTIDFAKHLVKSKTPERKFLATIRELLNRLLTNISD